MGVVEYMLNMNFSNRLYFYFVCLLFSCAVLVACGDKGDTVLHEPVVKEQLRQANPSLELIDFVTLYDDPRIVQSDDKVIAPFKAVFVLGTDLYEAVDLIESYSSDDPQLSEYITVVAKRMSAGDEIGMDGFYSAENQQGVWSVDILDTSLQPSTQLVGEPLSTWVDPLPVLVDSEEEAVARLLAADYRLWAEVLLIDAPAAYQDYLVAFPEGLFVETARQALTETNLTRNDTSSRPEQNLPEKASEEDVQISTQPVETNSSEADVQPVLQEQQAAADYKQADSDQQKTWQWAQEADTLAAYETYILKYPAGPHLEAAQLAIDRYRQPAVRPTSPPPLPDTFETPPVSERAMIIIKSPMRIFDLPDQNVSEALFLPNGDEFLTLTSDNTAALWDMDSGDMRVLINGETVQVRSVDISSDGAQILVAGSDGLIYLWDTKTGYLASLMDNSQPVAVLSAAFSSDDTKIVVVAENNHANIWDLETGRKLQTLSASGISIWAATFSPDGNLILTSGESEAYLWDATSGDILYRLSGHEDWISVAIFSADGSRIMTGSWDDTARIWDTQTGKALMTLHGHQADVNSVIFSSDSARAISRDADGVVYLWDMLAYEFIGGLTVESDHHMQTAFFSPDSQWIVTGADSGRVYIWEAKTQRLIAILDGHKDTLRSAVFSPNSELVATVGSNQGIYIWDVMAKLEKSP